MLRTMFIYSDQKELHSLRMEQGGILLSTGLHETLHLTVLSFVMPLKPRKAALKKPKDEKAGALDRKVFKKRSKKMRTNNIGEEEGVEEEVEEKEPCRRSARLFGFEKSAEDDNWSSKLKSGDSDSSSGTSSSATLVGGDGNVGQSSSVVSSKISFVGDENNDSVCIGGDGSGVLFEAKRTGTGDEVSVEVKVKMVSFDGVSSSATSSTSNDIDTSSSETLSSSSSSSSLSSVALNVSRDQRQLALNDQIVRKAIKEAETKAIKLGKLAKDKEDASSDSEEMKKGKENSSARRVSLSPTIAQEKTGVEMANLHAELIELRKTILRLESEKSSSVRYLEWQRKTFPEVSQDEQDRLIKLRLESETQYSSNDRRLLDKLLVDGSIQAQKNIGDFHKDFPSTKGMTSHAISMAKGGYNKRGGIVATIAPPSLDEGSDLKIYLDDFGLLASTGEWGNDEVYQALIIT